jgi:hypothetical protein
MEFPMSPSLMLTILGGLFFTTVCVSSPAEDKPVPGSQVAREVKVKAGGKEVSVRYWQFVPKGYDGKKKLPLMLFLHGAGERGNMAVQANAELGLLLQKIQCLLTKLLRTEPASQWIVDATMVNG